MPPSLCQWEKDQVTRLYQWTSLIHIRLTNLTHAMWCFPLGGSFPTSAFLLWRSSVFKPPGYNSSVVLFRDLPISLGCVLCGQAASTRVIKLVSLLLLTCLLLQEPQLRTHEGCRIPLRVPVTCTAETEQQGKRKNNTPEHVLSGNLVHGLWEARMNLLEL